MFESQASEEYFNIGEW